MTEITLDFTLKSVNNYFKKAKLYDIYHDFYLDTHLTCSNSHLSRLNDYIAVQLAYLCRENGFKGVSHRILNDPYFNVEFLDSTAYNSAESIVKNVLGEKARPYLEEYELLGKYSRTLKFVMIDIYANATINAPDNVKTLLHSDTHERRNEDERFKEFKGWIKDNYFNGRVKLSEYSKTKVIPDLYEKVKSLTDFYRDEKQGSLYMRWLFDERISDKDCDLSYFRSNFINKLNRCFNPKRNKKIF